MVWYYLYRDTEVDKEEKISQSFDRKSDLFREITKKKRLLLAEPSNLKKELRKIRAERAKIKKELKPIEITISPPEDKFIWHVFGDFTNETPPVGIDYYTEDEDKAKNIRKRFEDKYGFTPEIEREEIPDFGILDDSFIFWHDKDLSKKYDVETEI